MSDYEFEEVYEPLEDDLMDFLEKIQYAGRTVDARHERIMDRSWRYADLHINSTIGTMIFNQKLLRELDFRGDARTHPGSVG